MLHELNWRLEVCLIPLWQDFAGHISRTLRVVNPFPGSIEIPDASAKLDDESLRLPPIPVLRRLWVELAHACLRFSRESQDDMEFDFWRSLLNPLTPNHPGLVSRIRYQECLVALGRIDHMAVRTVLNGWTVSDEDPFWLIRRAAILVELGELKEAEERAEAGLQAIREGIRPGADDLAMLSREGWAMKLVHAIRLARSSQFDPTDREFTGRWERLTESGCNPDPELELLAERLKRPMPATRSGREIVFSFDLGRASTTQHTGPSLLDQLLPALQSTRLVEEVAYPPHCGCWKLSGDLIKTAVTWIREGWPSMAVSLVLRLSKEEVLKEHFDRNSVAILSDATTLAMHRTLDGSLTQAMAILSSSEAVAGGSVRGVEEDLVKVTLELLSRLVFRLPQELILNEVKRAMALYRSPIFTRGLRFTDRLRHLFSRAIRALDPDPLSSCVFDLFSLPIPGVDRFAVADVHFWPEPTTALWPLRLGDVRDVNPESWSKLIQWLLRATSGATGEGRSRASLRLALLWDKGLLNSTEVEQFAAEVWAIRDGRTGLPTSTALLPGALLSLPEPEPGISQSLVKAFCLGGEFVPLCTTVTLPDGKAVRQFTFGTDPGSFLDAVVGVSRQGRRNADGRDVRWVQWNRHELRLILDKINNWWQNEGKGLCADRGRGMTRDQVLERHEKILSVIWRVLLPRCRPGDELSGRIRDLVLDFDTSGLPVLAAFPPLLRLFPDLLEETILRIRHDLFSRDEERPGHAMGALFIWATQQWPAPHFLVQ